MFFLEVSCFFHDPVDVGNLISGSSAFSKTSLNIWKFRVHILLKPGLENFENHFTSMWDECNCAVVWAFPTSEVRGRSREDPMPEGRRPRGITPRPRSGAAAESTRLRRRRNGREELPRVLGQQGRPRGDTQCPRSGRRREELPHISIAKSSVPNYTDTISFLENYLYRFKFVAVGVGHSCITLKEYKLKWEIT